MHAYTPGGREDRTSVKATVWERWRKCSRQRPDLCKGPAARKKRNCGLEGEKWLQDKNWRAIGSNEALRTRVRTGLSS